VLNHPGYRKDIQHGLRFWEASRVGLNVDDPADLSEVVSVALEDRQWDQWNRWSALDIVFGPYRTGAGVRAASALVQWAQTLEHVAA
jgi:hypothetical protein